MPNQLNHIIEEIAVYNSQQAYRVLYLQFYESLQKFAFSIIKSQQDAEEIVSDLFITIWSKRKELPKIDNLKLYLFVSIKNLAFNKIKQSKKHKTNFSEDYLVHFTSPYLNPSEQLLSKENMQEIVNAINLLPPKCKIIFRLVKEDGLKYTEVATLLNISIKTVEAQMAIATKRIKNNYIAKIPLSKIVQLKVSKN